MLPSETVLRLLAYAAITALCLVQALDWFGELVAGWDVGQTDVEIAREVRWRLRG